MPGRIVLGGQFVELAHEGAGVGEVLTGPFASSSVSPRRYLARKVVGGYAEDSPAGYTPVGPPRGEAEDQEE